MSVNDIVSLIAYGISKGKTTPHALDILGRTNQVKHDLKSKRSMICSDTHLQRLFADKLSIPDTLPMSLYQMLKPYLPSSNFKRLMVLDGSGQGGRLFSVGSLVTDFPFFMGLEPMEKKGKELVASRILANRLLKLAGNDFELYVADGLYFVYRDFQIVREKDPKKHLFVKTKEATLNIVQFAESEYNIDKSILLKDRSRYVKGFDKNRNCSYEIFRAKTFEHNEVNDYLYCYRVEEHDNRKNCTEVFYCITTAPDISLTQAREIAKKRWQIENNIFRFANQNAHTKHRFFADDTANTNFLKLLFILLSLLFFLYYLKILHQDKELHRRNFLLFAEYDIVLPAYQNNTS